MPRKLEEYGLDLHGTMILEEYREMLPVFSRMKSVILEQLENCIQRSNLVVTAIEAA